jgi:two-component system, NtrC family, sensor histidine kinase HydH
MAVKDTYSLLSTVVSIANSGKLSHRARLLAIADVLAETFRFASAVFYLPDTERRFLVSSYSPAYPDNPRSCSIPFGEGVAGECARRKTVTAGIPASAHPEEFLSVEASQLVAFPVVDEARLNAVLSVGLLDGFLPPHHEKKLLQDILTVVGGVVRTLMLAEWSERRVKTLTGIGEIGRILNRNLPPRELLRLGLRSCHKQTASSCTILRLFVAADPVAAGLFRKVSPRMRDFLPQFLELESEASARVAETKMPVLVVDLVAEEDIPPSYICVPLFFDSNPIGTVTFFGKEAKKGRYVNFDEEDRDLCESLAVMIAAGMESSLNYRKMELLAEENRKKVQELSLLYRMGHIVLSTINLNKLAYLILSSLTSGTSPIFDRAMLFLVNEKAGNMQGMLGITRNTAIDVLAVADEAAELRETLQRISDEDLLLQMESDFSSRVRGTRIPLDRSKNVSSRAVLEKRLFHIPDIDRERAIDHGFVRKFGISSFAVAPLVAKEKVVGIIVVDNHLSGKPIAPDELRFLQMFVNQAGMALENSILYKRVQDANRELYEAQERLIQGERLAAIGEMAAGIAHEVKSPLVSIGGFARRIQRRVPAGSDESKSAETIVRETERLERMLGDILTFSRKATICYTSCSIVDIIEDALSLLAGPLRDSGIRITKKLAPALPVFLGDSHQLKQVFLNLFANAHDAMRSGGELTIAAFTCRASGAPAIGVRVTDTGKGIPAEIIKKIFNPFFTTKPSGTGLGLSITNRIVMNHRGRIRVSNSAGGGAEFRVVMPIHP